MQINRIRANLTHKVRYHGNEYLFQECVLWGAQSRTGAAEMKYSAILQDKVSKSVLRVPIEEVDEIG